MKLNTLADRNVLHCIDNSVWILTNVNHKTKFKHAVFYILFIIIC